MARRSRNRIGRLAAGPMGAGGVLLLSLALASSGRVAGAVTLDNRGTAATRTATATKADSAKSHAAVKPAGATAKPGTTQQAAGKPAAVQPTATAKPGATPIATTTKRVVTASLKPPASPPRPKMAPPSRLATLPTAAPTRATGMPHPEALRAALARKAVAAAKTGSGLARATPANVAGPKAAATTATTTASERPTSVVPAGPRGAVTLSPAKPGTPVPMGIPVGNPKLAASSNRPSNSRAVPAGVTGMAGKQAAGGQAAGQGSSAPVSKMTQGAPGSGAVTKAGVAQDVRQGSVTPLGKAGPVHGPTVSMGKGTLVPAPPALEDQVAYQYNALGRRDPFNSLLDGEFVGDDQGGDAPPDLGGLKVVGIVWGSQDQFAMVEDVRGNSYVLRRGDKVMNGFVEGLKRDGMIVNITVDGQSQSVTVPITRKGEKSNANR